MSSKQFRPSGRKPVLFLYFPPCSQTIRGPDYGGTGLRWLLRVILRIGRSFELEILAHKGYEPSHLKSLIGSEKSLPLRYCSTSLPIGALQEAANAFDPTDYVYAYGTLATAFSPQFSLDLLSKLHEQNNSWCTLMSGLPDGVSPVIFDQALLEMAATVDRMEPNRDWSYGVEHVFRKCIIFSEKAGHPCGALTEVDAISRFSLVPQKIPETIDVWSYQGFDLLRRITRDFSLNVSNSESLLYAWKEEALRSGEEGVELHRHCSSRRKSNKIRILYGSNRCAYCGAEEALCRMIGALPPDKYDLSALIGIEGLYAERLRSLGVSVYAIGEFASPTMASAQIISKVISMCDPHIVHINSYSGVLLPALAKHHGSALVSHVRVSDLRGMGSDSLRSSDKVIAVSHYVKNNLELLNLAKDHIQVVYDGVDTTLWVPVTDDRRCKAKRHLGIDPSKIVVMMVARYERNKRQDVLINAIADSKERHRMHLVLVGESALSVEWENTVDELLKQTGLDSITTKCGFQSEVRDIQAAADVCVLCSEKEGLGSAILEAMAMAIPVIITETGGLAELIGPDERAGFILKAGLPSPLTAVLGTLVRSPKLRMEMGGAGRRICEQFCDARVSASTVDMIYRDLVDL